MLYISTTVANNLRSQIEAIDRLEVYWDTFLWPFALETVSHGSKRDKGSTYASKLVSFDLLRLAAAESSLVNQIGEILLHELINLRDGLVETSLGGTGDMKVERGVL